MARVGTGLEGKSEISFYRESLRNSENSQSSELLGCWPLVCSCLSHCLESPSSGLIMQKPWASGHPAPPASFYQGLDQSPGLTVIYSPINGILRDRASHCSPR